MIHTLRRPPPVLGIVLLVGALTLMMTTPVRSATRETILVTNPSTCPACRTLESSLRANGWQAVSGGFQNGDAFLRTTPTHPGVTQIPSLVEDGRITAIGSAEALSRATTLAQPADATFPSTPDELLQQTVPAGQREQTQSLLDRIFQQLNLRDAFKNLLQSAAQSVGDLVSALGPAPGAGRVSRYTNPDPRRIGFGPREHYSAPQDVIEGDPRRLRKPLGSLRTGQDTTSYPGINADPSRLHQRGFSNEAKPNVTDTPSLGTPCGGKPGDAYWARNCLCRCTRGRAPGVKYEVGIICPLDFNPCEDSVCGPIERHDNYVSTIRECKRQTRGHPEGGRPRAPFFGI